jgi:hypothetical protein
LIMPYHNVHGKILTPRPAPDPPDTALTALKQPSPARS